MHIPTSVVRSATPAASVIRSRSGHIMCLIYTYSTKKTLNSVIAEGDDAKPALPALTRSKIALTRSKIALKGHRL